jgi:hypothetical protein
MWRDPIGWRAEARILAREDATLFAVLSRFAWIDGGAAILARVLRTQAL